MPSNMYIWEARWPNSYFGGGGEVGVNYPVD